MTLDDIYSVFDGGDPETALMKLAVSFPRFGRCDLEDVLRILASSKDEYTRPLFHIKHIAGGITYSRTPTILSRGMEAFKTIFSIMFNTGLWDVEILFQPDFLPFVHGMRTKLAARAKATRYRDRWTSDLYEVFAEMEDRLVEKIRSIPEGTACPG